MKSYLELNHNYSIIEMETPKNWIGKSLDELNLQNKDGLKVISIKDRGSVDINPVQGRFFREEDIIVVVGKKSKIMEYIR